MCLSHTLDHLDRPDQKSAVFSMRSKWVKRSKRISSILSVRAAAFLLHDEASAEYQIGISIKMESAEQRGFSHPAAHPHASVFYNEITQRVLLYKWEIKKMPKKPYADTRLAKFIDKRVLELRPRKSQIEIAIDAGFVSVNMLSMLKKGSSKLPIDRVPSLARALEVDPAYLLRLTLEQAKGDTVAQALVEIMGTPVTGNELGWLQEIRSASDHTDPRMTGRNRAAIRSIFGK